MHGQRWVYRVGNSVVCVDNGFSWLGWGQERMVVNDETVQQSDGWLRLRQSYLEPWIVPGGEGVFRIRLAAGWVTVNCAADLDGRALQPNAIFKSDWSGPRRGWPESSAWIPVAP